MLALVIALNLLWLALADTTEYKATTTLPMVQQSQGTESLTTDDRNQAAGIESYMATPENRRILRQMVIETLPLETAAATPEEP
jgi:hypothetical protein